MIIRDFQPIKLRYCSEDTDCNCGKKGCDQRALMTDKVALQVGDIEYFTTEELLLNAGVYYGNFITNASFGANWSQALVGGLGISWFWNAGEYIDVALAGANNSKVVHTDVSFTFTACHMYRICFEITPSYGTACDFVIYLRDNATTTITEIKRYVAPTAGQYCFVYQPTATTTQQLGFRVEGTCGAGEGTTYTLDNASLREIEPNVKIYDCCDDSLIDTIEICDITVGDDYFNIEFLWEDYVIDEVCYKLCIEDVQLILGGRFTTVDDFRKYWSEAGTGQSWQHGTPGFAASPLMFVELAIGEESKILSQGVEDTLYYEDIGIPMNLSANCVYTLTFEAGSTAGDLTDWELELYINEELVQTYPAIGGVLLSITYIISLATVVNSIGFLIRDLRVGGAPGDIQISLDNVSIIHDICSDCICVKDTHDCTHLIKAWNDSDTESFAFPSLFAFYMRVKSKIRNWRYPTDEEIYVSSHGVSTLNYSKVDKIWDFQFDKMPEYMWDAAATLMEVDNLEIDGTKYIKIAGDIEPIHTRSNDLKADGSVEIKKKTSNRVK